MELRKRKSVNYNSTKVVDEIPSISIIKRQKKKPNGQKQFKIDLKYMLLKSLNSKGHGLKRVKFLDN
jgi:hypothetical protein